MDTKIKKYSLIRSFKDSLPTQLLQAREAAMSRFRPMLRRHGLTEQRWRVIRAIHEHGEIDASELARRSFLLSPSLTRILKYLEIEKDKRRELVAFNIGGQNKYYKYSEKQIQELFNKEKRILYRMVFFVY